MIDLNKDIIKYVNVINFMKDYPITRKVTKEDQLLIKGKSDYDWTYLVVLGKSFDIVNEIDDVRIMVQDDFLLDYFKSHYELDWILSCEKLVYLDKKLPKSHEVYELNISDASYIQSHNSYGDFTNEDYIKERIRKGIGLGIKVDNTLIAWILTHDDGAIGFMHVMPSFRGRGYAKHLTEEMIRRLLIDNKLPFVHIEKTNTKSQKLAEKSGFTYANDVHWIKIKEGGLTCIK